MILTDLSLLERLAGALSCTYLSDLHLFPHPCSAVCRALEAIPAGSYPDREWNDALVYLTGQPEQPGIPPRESLLSYYWPYPQGKNAPSLDNPQAR